MIRPNRPRTDRLRKLLGFAGVGGFLLLILLVQREPSYLGRTLSTWLQSSSEPIEAADMLDGDLLAQLTGQSSTGPPPHLKIAVDRARDAAVAHIGTHAIPWLLHWVAAESTALDRFRCWSAGWLEPVLGPWVWPRKIDPLDGSASPIRFRGFEGFAILGTNALPALPAMERLLYRTPEPMELAWAIAQLGPQGVSVLTNALANSTNTAFGGSITMALALEGSKAAAAMPALVACLEPARFNDHALDAIARIGGKHPEIVPRLRKLLSDPAAPPGFDSITAIYLLGLQGDAAKPAIPEILAVYPTLAPATQTNVRQVLDAISPGAGGPILTSQTH